MSFSSFAAAARPRLGVLCLLGSIALCGSPHASANSPPKIYGTPLTSISAWHYYTWQPSAYDPDGTKLTFAISNKPSWATFDTTTGRLYGTAQPTSGATYSNIVISASDGVNRSYLPAFSLKVNALLNSPPKISGTPPTSAVPGQAYAFQPTASDPNGLIMSFVITNKPAWASFDSKTGRLYGTPTTSNIGTTSNILINVYDGFLKGSLPAFSITVAAAANHPPTISGTPPTSVTVSSPYSFTPKASDPDGNPLTFNIQNKPAWASFNTQSGLLSGIPASADAGTFSNIIISTTDGQATASLPAFSITVNQIATGSATLSWAAPLTNTDGSTLTDLAGYKLYYGTSTSNLDHTLTIANPGLTSYVVSNLSAGTWYFSMTAYNSSGAESDRSAVASIVTH